MSQSRISSELDKKVCEASCCFAKATAEIAVKVGQQHTIILNLCENCVAKFQDS
jgi:hypothetical protein